MKLPVPKGSRIFQPALSTVRIQMPPTKLCFHVPISSVGGDGAGTTRAIDVRRAFLPSLAVARTVKRWRPGASHDVTSQLVSSP